MSTSLFNWHVWDRIRLRTLSPLQFSSLEKQLLETHSFSLHEPSSTDQSFIHRLVLLLWIDEIELAQELWKKEKHHFLESSLEETLFKLVICEREGPGWGYRHPEFDNLVRYCVLWEEQAFKLSTIPLSDLLSMDKPNFSSVDGLIDVQFDKSELERIANIVPKEYHRDLRLPLIFLGPITDEYQGKYKVIGSNLENFLLQKLLKLTSVSFEKYKVESVKSVNKISTLNRRRFKTIYKVFPHFERSPVWLSVTYNNPFF